MRWEWVARPRPVKNCLRDPLPKITLDPEPLELSALWPGSQGDPGSLLWPLPPPCPLNTIPICTINRVLAQHLTHLCSVSPEEEWVGRLGLVQRICLDSVAEAEAEDTNYPEPLLRGSRKRLRRLWRRGLPQVTWGGGWGPDAADDFLHLYHVPGASGGRALTCLPSTGLPFVHHLGNTLSRILHPPIPGADRNAFHVPPPAGAPAVRVPRVTTPSPQTPLPSPEGLSSSHLTLIFAVLLLSPCSQFTCTVCPPCLSLRPYNPISLRHHLVCQRPTLWNHRTHIHRAGGPASVGAGLRPEPCLLGLETFVSIIKTSNNK